MTDRGVVCRCGKAWKAGARGWDPERRRCRDAAACMRRSTAGMATRPFVGDFDPEAAYRAAPKLGDGG